MYPGAQCWATGTVDRMAGWGDRWARIRRALKAFGYSGTGRDRWQFPDRVLDVLALQPGDRVADLGAGGGYFTFRLADAVGPTGRVYAVDTDPDMRALVTEGATRSGHDAVVAVPADPRDPKLPEPVDLVLLVNAFHHLPEPAPYLRTLARYLRPSARVAVIESRPKWSLFGHATEPGKLRSVMEEAGYSVAQRHEFLPRQSFQVFTLPAA
jgi:arsenite methyltransferase